MQSVLLLTIFVAFPLRHASSSTTPIPLCRLGSPIAIEPKRLASSRYYGPLHFFGYDNVRRGHRRLLVPNLVDVDRHNASISIGRLATERPFVVTAAAFSFGTGSSHTIAGKRSFGEVRTLVVYCTSPPCKYKLD